MKDGVLRIHSCHWSYQRNATFQYFEFRAVLFRELLSELFVKSLAFALSTTASMYLLVWHHVSTATKVDALFALSVVTAAVMGGVTLLCGVIVSFWLLKVGSVHVVLRLAFVCILASLPAAIFVAQPVAEFRFSLGHFIVFPMLFTALVFLFGQGPQLDAYSEGKIESTLHELGLANADQPATTRMLIYGCFAILVGLAHMVIT